jgi:hypothetical protein
MSGTHHIDMCEGRRAGEQLVDEHSEGPQVHGLIVARALHHLGRQILRGAAQRVSLLPSGEASGRAEVRNLQITNRVEELGKSR